MFKMALIGSFFLLLAGVSAPGLGLAGDGNVPPPGYGLGAETRPEADKERDPFRKPRHVGKQMGVEPGDVVIDVGSGQGYYTEVFARAVGTNGKVYSILFPGTQENFPQIYDALAERTEYLGNIIPLEQSYEALDVGEKADAAFLGLLYHELIRQNLDRAAVNKSIFEALKPGGVFALTIHRAREGAGEEASSEFHRTDLAFPEQEIRQAGFVLVEKNTDLLENPDDPLDVLVFEDWIRGKSSRILYIFKKPEN